MKNMSKKILIPWIVSFLLIVATVVAIILDSTGALSLSGGARNVLGVTVAAALIVFGYTSCKYAGALKGQQRKK